MDVHVYADHRRDPKSGKQVPRGTWFFVINVTDAAGKRVRQIKRRGFASEPEAWAEALKTLRDLETPSKTVEETPATPPPPAVEQTLEEYLEGWLAAVRVTLEVTAWTNYRTVLRTYVIPWIGGRDLTAVSDDDLSTLYGDLLAHGGHRWCHDCDRLECENGRVLSATTVRLAHRILHKALADGYKVLPVNPADHARVPKKAPRQMRTWNEQEMQQFLAAIANDRLMAAWFLALTVGLRRGELAGLRWSDLNLDHAILSVAWQRTTDNDWNAVEKEPKGKSKAPVALGPMSVQVLREHRERQQKESLAAGDQWNDCGKVFVAEDGSPYHPSALYRRFQTLCSRAHVPVIRLHEARHTSATVALLAGVHPKVVQERLRHASIKTTMDIYSHVTPTMQVDAAQRIEDVVTGADNASTTPQEPDRAIDPAQGPNNARRCPSRASLRHRASSYRRP
jgi:integrase